jgi:hypothetical protein
MRVPGVAAVSCGYSKFTEAYSNSLVSVFFVEAFFYFVRGFLLGFAKFCQAAQEGRSLSFVTSGIFLLSLSPCTYDLDICFTQTASQLLVELAALARPECTNGL